MNIFCQTKILFLHIFWKKIKTTMWRLRYISKAYGATAKWMRNILSSLSEAVKSISSLRTLIEQILRYVPVARMAGGRMAARAKAKAKAKNKAKAKASAPLRLPIADWESEWE